MSVTANLSDGESVSEVHADIVNGTNLAASSAVVVRFDGKTALVRYRLQGGPCPAGEGRGDVAVNFVTNSRRAFPVEATHFVRRDLLTFRPGTGTVMDVPVAPTQTPRFGRPVRGGAAILARTPPP
jgi:hypothetical protein